MESKEAMAEEKDACKAGKQRKGRFVTLIQRIGAGVRRLKQEQDEYVASALQATSCRRFGGPCSNNNYNDGIFSDGDGIILFDQEKDLAAGILRMGDEPRFAVPNVLQVYNDDDTAVSSITANRSGVFAAARNPQSILKEDEDETDGDINIEQLFESFELAVGSVVSGVILAVENGAQMVGNRTSCSAYACSGLSSSVDGKFDPANVVPEFQVVKTVQVEVLKGILGDALCGHKQQDESPYGNEYDAQEVLETEPSINNGEVSKDNTNVQKDEGNNVSAPDGKVLGAIVPPATGTEALQRVEEVTDPSQIHVTKVNQEESIAIKPEDSNRLEPGLDSIQSQKSKGSGKASLQTSKENESLPSDRAVSGNALPARQKLLKKDVLDVIECRRDVDNEQKSNVNDEIDDGEDVREEAPSEDNPPATSHSPSMFALEDKVSLSDRVTRKENKPRLLRRHFKLNFHPIKSQKKILERFLGKQKLTSSSHKLKSKRAPNVVRNESVSSKGIEPVATRITVRVTEIESTLRSMDSSGVVDSGSKKTMETESTSCEEQEDSDSISSMFKITVMNLAKAVGPKCAFPSGRFLHCHFVLSHQLIECRTTRITPRNPKNVRVLNQWWKILP